MEIFSSLEIQKFRFRFNFNTGFKLSQDALDYVNNHEEKYSTFRNYTKDDYWTQFFVNMSSVEAVTFNADVWMPAGAMQLSQGDSGNGAFTTANFDWQNGFDNQKFDESYPFYQPQTITTKAGKEIKLNALLSPKHLKFDGTDRKIVSNGVDFEYTKSCLENGAKDRVGSDPVMHCNWYGTQKPIKKVIKNVDASVFDAKGASNFDEKGIIDASGRVGVVIADGATGPFAGYKNYGVFIRELTEFSRLEDAKAKCGGSCEVTLTLQTQSTWDQEMAGCTSLQTDNHTLGGDQIGHAYLCHFWWAINPLAKKWFKLIEKFNAQTYAWSYDEFYVPDGAAMGKLKDVLQTYQANLKDANGKVTGGLKKNLANKIFGYLARCEFWVKIRW